MVNEIELVIPGREASLGGFSVRRVLPYAKRRMIGPFIFWDHMGPHVFSKGFGLSVGPHPHIGLSTLTYILEGRVLHRDSLGNEKMIRPFEVNWMTAGKGIAHSERSPEQDMAYEHRLHGLQLWVALPDDQEDRDASFVHIANEVLPRLELGASECTLIAGSALGKTSPVPIYSPMFLMDVDMKAGEIFAFEPDDQEAGIYVAQGKIQLNREDYQSGQMIVLNPSSAMQFAAHQDARVFVFGGKPFSTPRHVWWNFVSSSKEKIEQAKFLWETDQFPPVFNETNFSKVPLPQS